jgi:hypothetical protein
VKYNKYFRVERLQELSDDLVLLSTEEYKKLHNYFFPNNRRNYLLLFKEFNRYIKRNNVEECEKVG